MSIAEQLDQLRQEYKTASPERREELKRQAELLKAGACSQCHERERPPEEAEHFPFCSDACHKAWADANDHGSRIAGKRPTIRELQRRLLERAREAHLKGATR